MPCSPIRSLKANWIISEQTVCQRLRSICALCYYVLAFSIIIFGFTLWPHMNATLLIINSVCLFIICCLCVLLLPFSGMISLIADHFVYLLAERLRVLKNHNLHTCRAIFAVEMCVCASEPQMWTHTHAYFKSALCDAGIRRLNLFVFVRNVWSSEQHTHFSSKPCLPSRAVLFSNRQNNSKSVKKNRKKCAAFRQVQSHQFQHIFWIRHEANRPLMSMWDSSFLTQI